MGAKKVGLALGDTDTGIARSIATVSALELPEKLRQLQAQQGIDLLVVGMPVSSGGTETAAAKRIRKLGDKLAQERGLEVAYQDERLTSWEARETLRELGYKPAQIDAMEDQEAARLMLQAYLDRLKMPDRHPNGDKKPLWRD